MNIAFEESRSSLANPLFVTPSLGTIMPTKPKNNEVGSNGVVSGTVDAPKVAAPRLENPSGPLIERALAGDGPALTELVDRLTPVIQARVARSLLRNPCGGIDDPTEYLKDLTQEVFLSLFKNGGEVLRRWDPERGASLENFVGLVTERKVISELRRVSVRPTSELPADMEPVDPSADDGPERSTGSKYLLHGLMEHFRRELSPLGWTLFELLFIWEGSIQEVSHDLNMNPEAVRKWRTRLRASARRWLQRKEREGS